MNRTSCGLPTLIMKPRRRLKKGSNCSKTFFRWTGGARRNTRVAHQTVRAQPCTPHFERCKASLLQGEDPLWSLGNSQRLVHDACVNCMDHRAGPGYALNQRKTHRFCRLATHKYQYLTLPSSCFFGCLQGQRCASKSKPSSSSSPSS